MYMLAVTERCRSSKNIIPTNTLLFRNGRTTETDFAESRTPRMTLPSAYLIKNSWGSRAHCITPRRRGSGTVFQRLNSSEKQVSKHFREVKTEVYAQKRHSPAIRGAVLSAFMKRSFWYLRSACPKRTVWVAPAWDDRRRLPFFPVLVALLEVLLPPLIFVLRWTDRYRL